MFKTIILGASAAQAQPGILLETKLLKSFYLMCGTET